MSYEDGVVLWRFKFQLQLNSEKTDKVGGIMIQGPSSVPFVLFFSTTPHVSIEELDSPVTGTKRYHVVGVARSLVLFWVFRRIQILISKDRFVGRRVLADTVVVCVHLPNPFRHEISCVCERGCTRNVRSLWTTDLVKTRREPYLHVHRGTVSFADKSLHLKEILKNGTF